MRFTFARMKGNALDFSFSGLKTAVLRWVQARDMEAKSPPAAHSSAAARHLPWSNGSRPRPRRTLDLLASFQHAVIRELLTRAAASAETIGARALIVSGGVACNSGLRAAAAAAGLPYPVHFPSHALSTDNAVMIAAAAFPKLARRGIRIPGHRRPGQPHAGIKEVEQTCGAVLDFGMAKIRRVALLILRIALGAVFVWSAYAKLREPWAEFAMDVNAYGVLPMAAVTVVAHTLPWAELLLGLVLITGLWQRLSTPAASLLLFVFISLGIWADTHGKNINCGCFGTGEAISWKTLLRDGVLVAASALLTWVNLPGHRSTV